MTADSGSGPMTDPVCGTPVNPQSVYQGSYRGAWFIFCSSTCRERFFADPDRILAGDPASDAAPPAGTRHWLGGENRQAADAATARVTSLDAARGKFPRPALAPDPAGPMTLPTLDRWNTGNAVLAEETPVPVVAPVFPGSAADRTLSRHRIFSFLVPMQQRKFARQVSRELLALERMVQACDAGLHGRDLYREVVRQRLLIDAAQADVLLDQAEESFATWPTPRALTFGDVVHMVVVTEFRARYGSRPWIEANLGAVVAGQIPHQL